VVVLLAVAGLGAWLAARGDDARAPARVSQAEPGPVFLVPGYGGGTGGLERLATRLRAAGHDATVLPLPGNGTGDLRDQAAALDVAVRSALAQGAPSVDVVGYSAGGLVARLWARDHGGAAVARRVVTLGSPHHGTDLAALAGLIAPGSCPLACRQMAPTSPLLARLDRGDETPAGPRWVSIWSDQDQVVTPPATARLAGALDVVVQSVCPGRRVGHGDLPTDVMVENLVVRMLGPALPTAPGRAACSALSRGER
jgi:triacylglycerol lipase